MTTLGKRYIALEPIVVRERTNGDGQADPNGRYRQVARDSDGDPIVDRYELHHNERLYRWDHVAAREAKIVAVERRGTQVKVTGRVLEIDLDLQPYAKCSEEERYQHAERLYTHYGAEMERLRPATYGSQEKPRVTVAAETDRDAITDALGDLAEDVDTPSLDHLRRTLDRLGLIARDRQRAMVRSTPSKRSRA